MHRGDGQLEVGSSGQTGDDLPLKRLVVLERGLVLRRAQQQGEGELRGALPDVSPAEAFRGASDEGQRFGRAESPAGEVDRANSF